MIPTPQARQTDRQTDRRIDRHTLGCVCSNTSWPLTVLTRWLGMSVCSTICSLGLLVLHGYNNSASNGTRPLPTIFNSTQIDFHRSSAPASRVLLSVACVMSYFVTMFVIPGATESAVPTIGLSWLVFDIWPCDRRRTDGRTYEPTSTTIVCLALETAQQ